MEIKLPVARCTHYAYIIRNNMCPTKTLCTYRLVNSNSQRTLWNRTSLLKSHQLVWHGTNVRPLSLPTGTRELLILLKVSVPIIQKTNALPSVTRAKLTLSYIMSKSASMIFGWYTYIVLLNLCDSVMVVFNNDEVVWRNSRLVDKPADHRTPSTRTSAGMATT